MKDLREQTEAITNYLRETVKVPVIEKWECEWKAEKRKNPAIRAFIAEKCPKRMKSVLNYEPSEQNI